MSSLVAELQTNLFLTDPIDIGGTISVHKKSPFEKILSTRINTNFIVGTHGKHLSGPTAQLLTIALGCFQI